MRTLFYDFFLPYKGFFSEQRVSKEMEFFDSFQLFFNEWKYGEEATIVIPLHTFDIISFDIRDLFQEYGYDESKRFILIGDKKQIEFSLTQNDSFLKNNIEEIQLPVLANIIEVLILTKLKG